jgi:hypothetical protein
MEPSKQLLRDFGEEFTEDVRDASIRSLEVLLEGRHGGENDLRLSEYINGMREEDRDVMVRLVRRFIEATLDNMLWMIERSDRFDLVAVGPKGELVSLSAASDGLSAEPYTEDGWYARHGKYGRSWAEME